jgi:hypothetical protein
VKRRPSVYLAARAERRLDGYRQAWSVEDARMVRLTLRRLAWLEQLHKREIE